MKKLASYLIILIAIFFLQGCSEEDVVLITYERFLIVPLEASVFSGFYQKKGVVLDYDIVDSRDELMRFLNISSYNAVITDAESSKLLEESKTWVPICTVAVFKGIKKFKLLVKKDLFRKKEKLVGFLKGWDYGVDLLKDPAVLKIVLDRLKIESIGDVKFFKCGRR